MELILLKNIEKVGRKFEIVQVKNGFGRNYLIPQGLAIVANEVNRNNLDSFKRQEAAKLEAKLDQFKEIAEKIKGQTLDIPAKCGTSGKIFGSITTLSLSNALRDQVGVDVDRRDILLPDNVKTIGSYVATLDLHPDVDAKVDFVVRPDDPKVAQAIAEAAEKEAADEARKAAARKAEEPAEEAAASGESDASEDSVEEVEEESTEG